MEILLLQDIPGVGKKNDLLVVGDGFALNCLLPRRAALVATPLVRKRYAEFIKRRAEEREKERGIATGVLSALSGKTISFKKKATKTGKLYAAISEQNIVDAIKEQLEVELSPSALFLTDPIKSTGSVSVPVRLGGQNFSFTVAVEPEKEEAVKKGKK